MTSLNFSIIIAGKICSGKSTLAKDLSKQLDIPIASFGEYLVNFSEKQGLNTEREVLQNLGNRLIKENHLEFLNNVIAFSHPHSKQFIFEGIRHQVILDEVFARSRESYSVFLDISLDLRLKRFLERGKIMDRNLRKEDFYLREAHPVEQEIGLIREKCTLIVQDEIRIPELLKSIRQKQIDLI